MTVADFSDRWRGLDVSGRIGDPEKRLARARRFALGTSAGATPRTAGLVGAAAAFAPALPWASYKLLTTAAAGTAGTVLVAEATAFAATVAGTWARAAPEPPPQPAAVVSTK